MKSLKLLIALCVYSFIQPAFSSVPMSTYQIPENISVMADGTLEVIFPVAFNAGCTNGEGKRMFVKVGNSQGVTEESLKQIQSFVLAASISRTPIKFWYDRINTTCEGGKVAMDVR